MHGKSKKLSSLFLIIRDERLKTYVELEEERHKIERGIGSMGKSKEFNRKRAEGGVEDAVKR